MRYDLLGNKKQLSHDSLVNELLKRTKTSISVFALFFTSNKNKNYVT